MSLASSSVTEEIERTQEGDTEESEVRVSVQFESADSWRWNSTGFVLGMPVADFDTTSM